VPDPQLNSEQRVLAAGGDLKLVLDTPGGFAGIGANEANETVGDWTVTNADGDADSELMLTRSLEGRSTLPRFRLLPGNNRDRLFRVTAYGQVNSNIVALGGLSTVRFAPGESLDLIVPFNLRPAYRAPRVLLTRPDNGGSSLPSALKQVYVEFSKVVDEGSLRGGLTLVYESSNGDVLVDGNWSLETVSVRDLGLLEQRSAATFQFEANCALSPGNYRIEANTMIRDKKGEPLDQDAVAEGYDVYLGRFTVGDGTQPSSTEVCTIDNEGCRGPDECIVADGQPYTCEIEAGGTVGKCVPRVDRCGESGLFCEPPYVCQPDSDLQRASCVSDCRKAGCASQSTDGNDYYCDEKTGLCLACSGEECGFTDKRQPGDTTSRWESCFMLCTQACEKSVEDVDCQSCLQRSCPQCLADPKCRACVDAGNC